MSTMSVFVTRQGADRPVVIDIRRNAYVGHLIDAAIAKLGLHVVPDMAVLRLATSEAGELGAALDPCKSLITAWVHEESKLVIEVLAAAPAEASLTESALRRILHEEREPVPVSISKATTGITGIVLRSAGVTSAIDMPLPELEPTFLSSFSPFSWLGGEDANASLACVRLTEYLRAAGAVIGDGGYKVVDVHRRNVLSVQLGRYAFKGKTDAIVVPFRQSVQVLVTSQARIIVDFKVDAASFDELHAQAEAELLTVSSLAVHNVMVVFTDLNGAGHILRAEGSTLICWRGCSVKQTVAIMVEYLATLCSPELIVGADDVRIPGPAPAKKARIDFVNRAHGLVRPNELLMEQLGSCGDGTIEGWMHAREVAYAGLGVESESDYLPSRPEGHLPHDLKA